MRFHADSFLAVVLDPASGLGGSWKGLENIDEANKMKDELVKWWYCTQKLVPRPCHSTVPVALTCWALQAKMERSSSSRVCFPESKSRSCLVL